MSDADSLKMYDELAAWWPLLSAPEDYDEEAGVYRDLLLGAISPPPRTLLELGSGGGNNASHLKASFEMTLVDLSPAMIEGCRALNPECEHHVGDMRTVRLGQRFDAVLIHDAIMYMTTEVDLRAALETAFIHCRPGGVALVVPDSVRESFEPSTSHGGHDGDGRGLRYLQWEHALPADETQSVADYVYILREGGEVRILHDRHVFGLFARDEWLRLLREVGFTPEYRSYEHSENPGQELPLFVGFKPLADKG